MEKSNTPLNDQHRAEFLAHALYMVQLNARIAEQKAIVEMNGLLICCN